MKLLPVLKKNQTQVRYKKRFNNQKILVVEDMISNVEVIRGFLEESNLEILVAPNGKIGIEMVVKHNPQLILMDMMMPVMNGYTCSRALKADKIYNKIPIIAITASALKEDEEEIATICDGYLRKPIAKEELISQIAAYLAHTTEEWIPEQGAEKYDFSEEVISEVLRLEIQKIFSKRFLETSALMSVDEISDFADEVIEFAEHKKTPMLVTYASHLKETADNFDVEEMNNLFFKFQELLD